MVLENVAEGRSQVLVVVDDEDEASIDGLFRAHTAPQREKHLSQYILTGTLPASPEIDASRRNFERRRLRRGP
jgi:hypothetical protein